MKAPVTNSLTLVSHTLCPYVQRASIVLLEKQAPFARTYINLGNKPDWFNAISPLGKTPVLLVENTPIFESAVICEYLDETLPPRLHPFDPLLRARHRGWMEFGSTILNTIGSFYSAADEPGLLTKARELRAKFVLLETELGVGPYFSGERFCVVDAVFAPVFRYFDTFDTIADFGVLRALPKVNAWRVVLATRKSVQEAVSTDYDKELRIFLLARNSALSKRMQTAA
jgi:glutathione S-transferase